MALAQEEHNSSRRFYHEHVRVAYAKRAFFHIDMFPCCAQTSICESSIAASPELKPASTSAPRAYCCCIMSCRVVSYRARVEQGQLAKWLVDNSCADRVFFCNSGAEANEAAIKVRLPPLGRVAQTFSLLRARAVGEGGG